MLEKGEKDGRLENWGVVGSDCCKTMLREAALKKL
jgi:hypothetical protein